MKPPITVKQKNELDGFLSHNSQLTQAITYLAEPCKSDGNIENYNALVKADFSNNGIINNRHTNVSVDTDRETRWALYEIKNHTCNADWTIDYLFNKITV